MERAANVEKPMNRERAIYCEQPLHIERALNVDDNKGDERVNA